MEFMMTLVAQGTADKEQFFTRHNRKKAWGRGERVL